MLKERKITLEHGRDHPRTTRARRFGSTPKAVGGGGGGGAWSWTCTHGAAHAPCTMHMCMCTHGATENERTQCDQWGALPLVAGGTRPGGCVILWFCIRILAWGHDLTRLPPRAGVFSTIPSPPRRALRRLPAAILQPSAADEGRKAALRGGEGTLPRLARVQHPQPLRRPLGQLVQPRAQTCLKNSSVEL